ncbi:MAG: nuclear transport factor 2 family protein [Acidiferrobacteraceae bacterium]
MDSNVAAEMLAALARTANARDYTAHMALVSPTVNVFGVPGFEVIGYDDWARQCKHEFEHGLLREVRYEGLHIVSATSNSVIFKTTETVEGADGTVNRHGIEILVRREGDGAWRVAQERILTPDEMDFDRRKSH